MASSSVVTLTEAVPAASIPASSHPSIPVVTESVQSFELEPLVRDPHKGKSIQPSDDAQPGASSRRPSAAALNPQPTAQLPSSFDECMSDILRMSKLSFDDVDFGQYSKLLEHTLVSYPEMASDTRSHLMNSLRFARKVERELPIQTAAQMEAQETLRSLPDPVAIRADLEAQIADARQQAEVIHSRKELVLAELSGCRKSLSLKEDQLALLDQSINLIGPDGHYTDETIADKASHHALFFKHQHFSHAVKALGRTLDLYSDKYKKMIEDLSTFANTHASRENPSDPPPE